MRKNMFLLCMALGILILPTLISAGSAPGTGITATHHDLRRLGGYGAAWDAPTSLEDPLNRLCIYCHAPHHTIKPEVAAANGLTYYPLWNHALSTITRYDLYQNTGTPPDIPNSIQHQLNANLTQPGSNSKLCLSCHDGSVAVSSYGYSPSGSTHVGTQKIGSSSRYGIGVNGDLRNHHPIGFDYNAVAGIPDDEIRDASTTLQGDNPYGLTINDLLFQNKMECASCHDVHNTKNTGYKFLWVEDQDSALCFSCHAK